MKLRISNSLRLLSLALALLALAFSSAGAAQGQEEGPTPAPATAPQTPPSPQPDATPGAPPAAPGTAPAAGTGTTSTPTKLELPVGTHLPLVLHNGVSTRTAKVGDPVYFETLFPVMLNGKVIVPAGSYVSGEITETKRDVYKRQPSALPCSINSPKKFALACGTSNTSDPRLRARSCRSVSQPSICTSARLTSVNAPSVVHRQIP